MKHLMSLVAAGLLVLAATLQASADVGWKVTQEIKTDSQPMDMAVSPDGQTTVVLTKDAKVNLYAADGALKGTIPVDKNVSRISLSVDGRLLTLMNSDNSQIQHIVLSFQFAIDTTGAPAKGKEDAPVVIAVFSDFQ